MLVTFNKDIHCGMNWDKKKMIGKEEWYLIITEYDGDEFTSSFRKQKHDISWRTHFNIYIFMHF